MFGRTGGQGISPIYTIFVSCIIYRDMLNALLDDRAPVNATPDFAFLTNYGKALLLIAQDPRIRMRDIAALLGVTERATQRIVAELAAAGYIDRQREGRRNLYTVRVDAPLGLPLQRDVEIGALLALLGHSEARAGRP